MTSLLTSRTYKIEISGNGGEIVVGKVNRAAYDYLDKYEIDITEMVDDAHNELEIPAEYLIIKNGVWEECDNIAHENGATMDALSTITVYDEMGDKVWTAPLDIDYLTTNNIECEKIAEQYIHGLIDLDAVFKGQSTEKGLFFGGTFTSLSEFIPSQLKFEYSNIDGWVIFASIQYDGDYVDNYEYDTKITDMFFDLILIK